MDSADVLITAPVNEVIATATAKAFLRVDVSDDDTLIDNIIAGVRLDLEDTLNRAFITQTREMTLDKWPSSRRFHLPRAPLQSVTSIKYTDEDGSESTYSSDNYIADTTRSQVVPAGPGWP